MVFGEELSIQTRGFSHITDLTDQVCAIVYRSGIEAGLVNVHAVGSTASISTIEFEPALNQDFQDQLEEFCPHTKDTRHSRTWGDDNGFSHIRSTMMGTSKTLPVVDKKPLLGTWQQVVLIDHDNRPRNRRVYIQVMGE
ncbi:MAG: secondary thiamine-phosphate synthase enzyme YjbQ [Fibrobacterota bacterium]